MKQETHPDYHEITVVMTDGTEFVTRSTYGAAGDRMQLDIDTKSHPAWTGQHRMVDRGGQLAKFNKRFSGLGGKKGEAKDAAPVAKEEKIKLTTKATPAAKKKKA
jgi:large subunit ribosomal protein L31